MNLPRKKAAFLLYKQDLSRLGVRCINLPAVMLRKLTRDSYFHGGLYLILVYERCTKLKPVCLPQLSHNFLSLTTTLNWFIWKVLEQRFWRSEYQQGGCHQGFISPINSSKVFFPRQKKSNVDVGNVHSWCHVEKKKPVCIKTWHTILLCLGNAYTKKKSACFSARKNVEE